jgi:hypothetical protein
MKVRSQKYAPGEIGRKGEEIYRRLIRPALEAENMGRLIGIDVDSEDFEFGDDVLDVTHCLLARRPDAWIAMLRVGGGPVDRIGFIPLAGGQG